MFYSIHSKSKDQNLSECIETRHVTSRKHVNNFLTVAQTQDVLMRINWTVWGNILNDRMENKGIRKQSRRKKREWGRRYKYENSIKSLKLHISHERGHVE